MAKYTDKKADTEVAGEAFINNTGNIVGEVVSYAEPAETANDPVIAPIDANPEKFCVYLGPSVFGVIQNGTIYKGTRQEVLINLADALTKHPQIATLIVTDKTLATDRVKIKTPGNALYIVNQQFAVKLKKGD
jgi:hypothetical protein